MRIDLIVGTRPETIKLAPVALELRKSARISLRVIFSGQHSDLAPSIFSFFSVRPDVYLTTIKGQSSLSSAVARLLIELDAVFAANRPDLVMVQGDTSTTFAAALAAFYRGIPVAHVEAGLRTGNLKSPFPEEANRVLTSVLAQHHFAPVDRAKENLLTEGISGDSILVTGNTGVDALRIARGKASATRRTLPTRPSMLVTVHRRENLGPNLDSILNSLKEIAQKYQSYDLMFPVHPNPDVADAVHSKLNSIPSIKLLPPLEYPDLVNALTNCHFVITDSGGIQEEAPYLAKPVLVLRNETERPEAVEAGVAKLVGADSSAILQAASSLIEDSEAYQAMASGASPFGDGFASQRIREYLEKLAK